MSEKLDLDALQHVVDSVPTDAKISVKHATLAQLITDARRLEQAERMVEKLEGLFQQTHGCHWSWVHKVTETQSALEQAERIIREHATAHRWDAEQRGAASQPRQGAADGREVWGLRTSQGVVHSLCFDEVKTRTDAKRLNQTPVRYVPADQVSRSAWVPVNEPELPDSDVKVLLWNARLGLCVASIGELKFTDDSEGHGRPYWDTVHGPMPLATFTHWMPLPAPCDCGAASQPRQGAADGEYASESIWRELNGLYEIAKAAWALRTSTEPEAAAKLDDALDFFANVATKARANRMAKEVPFPTAGATSDQPREKQHE